MVEQGWKNGLFVVFLNIFITDKTCLFTHMPMTADSRQGMPLTRAVPAHPMNLPAVAISTTRISMPGKSVCLGVRVYVLVVFFQCDVLFCLAVAIISTTRISMPGWDIYKEGITRFG